MKRALLKDSLKEIVKTKKRFFSIMLMAMLGVGFFAGIRATSPDMNKTIDNYYKKHNVYDIEIISTLGLTDEDVELFSQNEYVESVYGTYSKDVISQINDETESVVKISAIEDINTLTLESGRLPENENECVVESNFLSAAELNIGDKFVFDNSDEDLSSSEYTIVGTVSSPLYLSYDRGTSTLGSGKVNYCAYVLPSAFSSDVYTQIYIKVNGSTELLTGTTKYNELMSEAMDSIKGLEEEVNNRRYDELILEANNKIKEAEDELQSQKDENETKLNDAQAEIDSYTRQIDDSESKLNSKEAEAYSSFVTYEEQISQARAQIESAKQELESSRIAASEQIDAAKNTKYLLVGNITQIDLNLEVLTQKKNELYVLLENPGDISEEELEYYKQSLTEIEAQIVELEGQEISIKEAIYQIDEQIESASLQLETAQKTIEENETALNAQEEELEQTKSQTYSQISSARAEIASARETIAQSQAELDESIQEYNEKIAEAEEKIIDAREKVNDIEHPKLYILEREDNTGYSGFIQDTQSIANIGKVFPIVFFVVATLISLTSMTRMVEEQRQQIGTLKALGYTKLQISSKYIIYASIATIVGGIIGMTICFYLLPKIIWMMYSMMYSIPDFVVEFNLEYGAMGLICAYVCIVGATIYSCIKELVEKPAVLMRPKAPKSGKRVILENIPFIWNKFDFTTKVTVRNMFRYKKRFLMTIIGILGCTALIVTGFGIKDSISTIIDNQFKDVFNYDYLVATKTTLSEEEKNELESELINNEKTQDVVKIYASSYTLENGDSSIDAQAFVPDNDDIYSVVNFKDLNGNEVKIPDDGIMLTDKGAEILNVQEGDTIYIVTDSGELEVKVVSIVENYIQHYIYMSKETYTKIFNEEYSANCFMINNIDGMEEADYSSFAKEMLANSKVSSVTDINTSIGSVEDMMNNLNYVVWVLIVSSGLLAFVVLYNLANVNISERIRELATIKVLGFYDKEVYDYVSKETTVLTVIGIALGLVGGTLLTTFILKTCEINVLRFKISINTISYIVAVLITVLFTLIVNIATYFTLKKIDMIESLKSVE